MHVCHPLISGTTIRERLRGNRHRGNRPERFWEVFGSQRTPAVTSERTPWRISHRMQLSEVSRHPLGAPLRVPFSSQSCRSCCPYSCCPLKLLQHQLPDRQSHWPAITAGFLYRAGADTPLNIREKFQVSPRNILKIFSAVDTQTAVLVSTAEVWISAPDTQTPISLGFPGIHSWLWFFCPRTKIFGKFPEVPVPKIRVSAPGPYKNPTVMLQTPVRAIWPKFKARSMGQTEGGKEKSAQREVFRTEIPKTSRVIWADGRCSGSKTSGQLFETLGGRRFCDLWPLGVLRSRWGVQTAPKNLLRLFLRSNLKKVKKTPKIEIPLRIAIFCLFYSVCFGGLLKTTSGNKSNSLRLNITSKDS